MIIGVGIDLVELSRIKETFDQRFIDRMLSEKEKEVYESIVNEQTKLSYLGGRFAAKEAIFKAISKGDKSANFKDFSVLNDENGKPYVISKYFKNEIVHLSITHTKNYAIAYCLIEEPNENIKNI